MAGEQQAPNTTLHGSALFERLFGGELTANPEAKMGPAPETPLHVAPQPSVLTDLDVLEMAFTSWLTMYEMCDTERWRDLFSRERVALAKVQWNKFLEELNEHVRLSQLQADEKAVG
jgi:hypothetical protein